MKKLLAALLALMLLLGTTAAMADSWFNEEYVEVTRNASLHTGAGAGFPFIGSITKGTSLTYGDKTQTDSKGVEWYRVVYNGGFAWISSEYADMYDSSAEREQVRRSEFTAVTDSDLPVMFIGEDGNLYSSEVEEEPIDETEEIEVDTLANITGVTLNVRVGPSTDYEIITELIRGDQVPYLSENAFDEDGVCWYKVLCGGEAGWISSAYCELVKLGDNGYVYAADLLGSTVKGSNGDSYLRVGPGLNYDKAGGVLKKGETASYEGIYSVDDRGVAWYYIYTDGQYCWVSSRYTKLY